MLELERPAAAGATALDVSVEQLSELLRRRGLICLISDMLAPLEKLERQLGLLAAMGHDIVLFHVMDRAEIEFSFEQAAQFRDAETGIERFVDPAAARAGYLKRLEAHLAAIRQTCDRQGIEYQWCPTDKPLERALFDFLSLRNRQGVRGRRTSASRAAA
jgi:hypothetical protein